MKKIILEPLFHHNQNQIAIKFGYDDEIRRHLRLLPNINWSKTHKAFYSPYSKENIKRIFTHLRAKNWFIDYSAFKHKDNQIRLQNKIFKGQDQKHLNEKHINSMITFKRWMFQKRYSHNTIETYLGLLKVFFTFFNSKAPAKITTKDVIYFNNEYILKNDYSIVFQQQLISALKLFYTRNPNDSLIIDDLERPRKNRKLPEVLTKEEITEIINAHVNIKHKTLLGFIYACGLRIGETLSLKLSDIDISRNVIHIKKGKGAKDRYVPISSKTIAFLKKYIALYNPRVYLFEGVNGQSYSQASARKILKNAIHKTNIKKNITLHTLRHSYATHLLENGTDLRYIQEILGHCSPKTTMIYTHVSTSNLKNIKNPFDDLDL